MTWKGPRALPLVALVVGLIGAAGCASDESGEDTTPAQVSVPTITSPLGTTSTPATSTAPGKQNPSKTTGGPGGAGGTGGSAPCAIPESFQSFKYGGLDCAAAVAVARAWDSNGKACNTVDNPNVDEGYRRTCSVEGYSCTAKRDVHSDARFVTCTQGGQSVRFTWLPA